MNQIRCRSMQGLTLVAAMLASLLNAHTNAAELVSVSSFLSPQSTVAAAPAASIRLLASTSDAEILAPLEPVEEQDVLAPLEHVEDQDPLAPLEPVEKKSDAVEDPPNNDLAYLLGFQLRPPFAWLKVRQSALLTVRYCFQTSVQGEKDQLASLMTECDPSNMGLTPLLEQATTSNWSVNGIEGGNAEVGTIKAQGNGKAMYTAPADKPDSETIAVSVEILTEGRGKTIVVAAIPILDELRVYYGTLLFSGKGENMSFRASGEIAFKESGPGSDSFNSVGGWLDVRYTVDDCPPFQCVLPLHGELYLDTPEQGKHQIAWFTEAFEVSCHGIKLPQGVLTVLAPCDGKSGTSDAKNLALRGASSCAGIDFKWQLTRQ